MARLSQEEFQRACQMWESGRFQLKEIAKEFNVSISALHRRFTRNGIVRGVNAEIEKRAIQQAISEKVSENEALMEMITEVRELNLKGAISLSKRALIEIKKASTDKVRLGNIDDDLKAIERASKILNLNYNTAEKILHLDKDDDDTNDLPELEVTPMTQDDIDALRKAQEEEEAMLSGESEGDLDLSELEDELDEC